MAEGYDDMPIAPRVINSELTIYGKVAVLRLNGHVVTSETPWSVPSEYEPVGNFIAPAVILGGSSNNRYFGYIYFFAVNHSFSAQAIIPYGGDVVVNVSSGDKLYANATWVLE